tara:strand:+ start:27 stop:878 length:852 start_codon:yes stop_codon:yes gene_type:complete
MKFSLWTQYGALNSAPVFDAFRQGAHCLGFKCIENSEDADVDVIWSVLFNGRMAGNKAIWERNSANSKPTIVLEVGGINRGTTWKVGLNGINRDAYFGEQDNDRTRADYLGLGCKPWRSNGDFILVCGQHDKSLQWQNMPRMSNWFLNTYDEIRKHTERPILFRPHPRCRLEHIERGLKNVHRQEPVKIGGSYDDFDMKFKNIHATISYSSNPGIHSILNGVPAFVGTSSLAYDAGNDIDFMHDIEAPFMPDRTQWLNDYAHTEWTTQEISQGIPLNLLTDKM